MKVKLKNNFDTSANLEIYKPTLKDWFRVTSREFRSFNGKRRINNVEYNGPVYDYNTNTVTDLPPDSQLANYVYTPGKRQYGT